MLLNELLEVLYNKEIDGRERTQEVFRFTEGHFVERRFQEVDDLLAQFDPTQSVCRVGNGLLRSTGRVREHLPHWNECRDKVVDFHNDQGMNTKHLLVGLLND
jgi:hypothetical protein